MIEAALEAHRPGRWVRLSANALDDASLRAFSRGWRVEFEAGEVLIEGVDHLLILLDSSFPNSQPRILAPQLTNACQWPHVEAQGVLCLRATRATAAIDARVIQHLDWAIELLRMKEAERQSEFEREFCAYWGVGASTREGRPLVLSLVKPGGPSRAIVSCVDGSHNRIVLADTKPELQHWLRSSGSNPGNREILPTWLVRLRRPWAPGSFPTLGRDITSLIPREAWRQTFKLDRECPVMFEAKTPTGPAFAAVVVRGPTERAVVKGFRSFAHVPDENIVAAFAARPVERLAVNRVDGTWVHGRDHDPTYRALRSRTVAVIGCGAIGSSLARLLAQAGVGAFVLVDADDLKPANISRHALGMRFVGRNKAQAVHSMLSEDFPHLSSVVAYPKCFQRLTRKEREVIAACDLIVSAGIDFDGDAAIDAWRSRLPQPPAHVCTWTEAFAVAGHAVALFRQDALLAGFDELERPLFRLTDWPEKSGTMIVEAGCGNAFQPHGAIDLSSVTGMASSLVVDTLLGKVPRSLRREWLGDRDAVIQRGGTLRATFDARCVVREMPWL